MTTKNQNNIHKEKHDLVDVTSNYIGWKRYTCRTTLTLKSIDLQFSCLG